MKEVGGGERKPRMLLFISLHFKRNACMQKKKEMGERQGPCNTETFQTL